MAHSHIELIAAASQFTGDGNSADFEVPAATMGRVALNITAVSGTTPSADWWLEDKDPTTGAYHVLPYDQQITEPATLKSDAAGNTHRKNINGTAAATATGKHVAVYKHLAGKTVRLRWSITGTFSAGQGFTLGAGLDVK